MSKPGNEGGKGARAHADTRKLAALLSALATTPDDALVGFRDRRVRNEALEPEVLLHARDLLDEIAGAILSTDAARWQRLERAWEVLCGETAASRSSPGAAPDEVAGPRSPSGDRAAPAGAAAPVAQAPAVVATPSPVAPDRPALVTAPPVAVAPRPTGAGGRAQAPHAPPWLRVDPDMPTLRLDPDRPTTLDAAPGASQREVLPFRAGDAAARPPAPSAPSPWPDEDPLFATVAETEHEPPRPALPFKSAAREREAPLPDHLTAMSVERYAALCAESAARPESIAEIHARHGIADEAERALLDGLWRKRMAFDSRLEQSWRWHVARLESRTVGPGR